MGCLVGAFLDLCLSGPHVFRTTLLSLVLSLAVGQNASLLCSDWCRLQPPAESDCHHQASINSPGVMGENSCNDAVFSVGAFLREESRPGGLAPNVVHAVAVPRYQLAQFPTDDRPGQPPGREWSFEVRHLSVALRI